VLSCAQRAHLFASLFTEVMAESAPFKAPVRRKSSVVHINHRIFSLFCNNSLRDCGGSLITRFLTFLFVLMMNFFVSTFLCMYVRMYVCTYVWYIRMYVFLYIYIYIYIYVFFIVACSITGSNTTCLNVIYANTMFGNSYIN